MLLITAVIILRALWLPLQAGEGGCAVRGMKTVAAKAAASAPRHKQAQVVKVIRLLSLRSRLLPLGVVGFQEGRVHIALRTCHTHKEGSVCQKSRR